MIQKELLIIDGTALLFKMYFGGMDLYTPDRIQIGAVFGTTRAVAALIQQHKSSHVAVVFDAGQRTFRNDLEVEYKANRGDPPPDLIPQFDFVLDACQAMGCSCFRVPGYEADDLVATLVREAKTQGFPVTMVTDDKDVSQLISDAHNVRQFLYSKKAYMSEIQVLEKFGVYPHQLLDFLTMVGDSSDNIKGIHGLGPKSVSALLQYFGSLDGIYANIQDVEKVPIRGAKSAQQKLIEGKTLVDHTKQLIRLCDTVELSLPSFQHLRYIGPKLQSRAIFQRLGFNYPYTQLIAYAENHGL